MNAARNDQLSTSWHQFLGTALGPHPDIGEILESPLSVLAMPLIPAYELFSERVSTFKPENQILG